MLEGSIGSPPALILENVQYTDEKLNELIQELYHEWEQASVPENHKIYYIESINSLSKFDAIEKLLKEVNEFKVGKANI